MAANERLLARATSRESLGNLARSLRILVEGPEEFDVALLHGLASIRLLHVGCAQRIDLFCHVGELGVGGGAEVALDLAGSFCEAAVPFVSQVAEFRIVVIILLIAYQNI